MTEEERKARRRILRLAWDEKNGEKLRMQRVVYYAKHKKRIAEQRKERRKNNGEVERAKRREYRQRTIDHVHEMERRRYERNPKRSSLAKRRYFLGHKSNYRAWHRGRKYGISVERVVELEKMSESRGMKCPICGVTMTRGANAGWYGECFDHIHGVLGDIYDVICNRCNLSEGFYGSLSNESRKRLREYVEAKEAAALKKVV